MAANLENIFRKTLRKFKIEELPEVLDDWDFLPKDVRDKKLDFRALKLKDDLVWKITQLSLARQLSADDIAHLDLLYITRHPNTEKWTMYEMKPAPTDTGQRRDRIYIPDTFLDAFYNCLDNFFDVNVKMMADDGVIWLRVYVPNDWGQFLKTNVIYIVHYPKTNFLAISRMKVKHDKAVISALRVSLNLDTIKPLSLTGYDVSSLFQLAVNKNNQDLGRMWSEKIGENPLTRPQKRKREDEPELEDDRIYQAELPAKRQRKQVLLDLYGTDQLPTLQKIEYKLESHFRGKSVPELLGQPFNCTVKFEGPSVLEGVRQLVSAGVMNLKMPAHVKNLPFLGRNHVTLSNREDR